MEARSRRGAPASCVVIAGLLLILLGWSGWVGKAEAAPPPSFGVEGSGAGEMSGETSGVAVDQESGDVFIADRNNGRVEKYGPEGQFLLAWGFGVADGTTEALQVCTTTCFGGHVQPPFVGAASGQFNNVEGIAVDNSLSSSHGDVYVVDVGNHRVEKFGPEGEFLLMLGGEVNVVSKGNVCLAGEECQAGVPGTGAGEFEGLTGRSVAVGSTGTLYVADEGRVQLFSPAGAVEGEVALAGTGIIENLAVDSNANIYASGSGFAGVHKFDKTGAPIGAPLDEAGEAGALTIAIGPSNELIVNDLQQGAHHIVTFAESGEQTASFDAGGFAQDGRRGIAYGDGLEALYVLNEGTARIVTPPPAGPLVLAESENATEIQPTTATLNAEINPEGAAPTSYEFEYGTSTSYGEHTPITALAGAAFEDQPATAALTGLQPSVVYHFRVVATNGTDTTFGPDKTFTTLPPISVDQTFVSEVTDISARLEAELNPHGVASEYHFEYDTTPYAEGEGGHGTAVPVPDSAVAAGSTDTTVGNLIQGLSPSTTYYYRVVAHNTLGTVVGPGRSFATQGASSRLADGRSWELVSPANKHGAPIEPITEEGGLIQAAAAGGGFAYVSLGPINSEPKGVRSPHDSQLLAARGPEGWSTQDITTPHEEISIIHAGFPSEYKFFAENLSASLVEPQGVTPLSSQTTERTPYRREANGEFTPLVTSANVPPGTEFGGVEAPEGTGQFSNGVIFDAASPDLSRVVVESPQLLAPGFAQGFEPTGAANLYELGGGALSVVSVLPDGKPASEEGLSANLGNGDLNVRGAISDDGERVVFETGAGASLYTRDIGLGQTVKLNEIQPGAAGGSESAVFQAASGDGSKVFFTDANRLTTDATARPGEPDLYMCEITLVGGHLHCTVSDLSVGVKAGESANVQGEVSAIDASGSHVYFAANGVLTNTPNARGERAVPGVCNGEGEATCNLYVYDTDTREVGLVAVLASGDGPDWAGRHNLAGLGNLTARSSPNGDYFAFMSQRSLTGYDNRDVNSGALDEEVFLFDSSDGSLHCTSCDPTGARPKGVFDKEAFPGLLVDHPRTWFGKWLAGSIPGWTLGPSHVKSLYQSRYLSDSGRMFFNAADALAPQDTNNAEDVYEFEPPGVGDCTNASSTFSMGSGGCVSLVSSGESREESAFMDASESGDEVFFLTASRLTSSDVDGAFDVYDAHVCSASSPCPPPPPPPAPACEGDACQSPSAPPGETSPASLTYKGPQNQAAPAPAVVKPAAKPTRKQLLASALKACKKKAKSKRPACERQARKKYGVAVPKAKAKAKKKSKAGNASRGHGRTNR
jgi:hypothetical protein